MTFLWSGFLYLLALIPALVAFYVWVLHRPHPFAVHYSSLTLLHDVLPGHTGVRRHLPFGLFMTALASLVVALSRPVSIVTVPAAQATIILAIDVSRSMCSKDIQPTRLQAAEAAALTFIRSQKPNTRFGLVAFSGFAELIQAPTTDQDALEIAIQSLLTGRRTAIGSGILKSLDAIAEVDKTVAPSVSDASPEVTLTPVPKRRLCPRYNRAAYRWGEQHRAITLWMQRSRHSIVESGCTRSASAPRMAASSPAARAAIHPDLAPFLAAEVERASAGESTRRL